MAQGKVQKLKMLKLIELLELRADKDRPLTSAALCSELAESGIVCDRRTLSKDIRQLNESGYSIKSVFIGHEKAYYSEKEALSSAEIRFLIDAVQAAAFLPAKESDQLAAKLSRIGAQRGATEIQRTVHFRRNKHTNDAVFATVELLNTAIIKRRQVSFLYYQLDAQGQKVYRRNGRRSVASPLALIYNDGEYYMLTISMQYGKPTTYRIDRMEAVALEEKAIDPNLNISEEDIADFVEQTFSMFSGDLKEVVLQFQQSLARVIYDKFGEDVKMIPYESDFCIATVRVQVSPTFWGWLFQFAGKMKILSPVELAAEYRRLAELAGT